MTVRTALFYVKRPDLPVQNNNENIPLAAIATSILHTAVLSARIYHAVLAINHRWKYCFRTVRVIDIK